MLATAGHPVTDGVVSDALLDSLVVWGDADAVGTRLATLLERGVDELMVSHTPEAADRDREDALLEVLGGIVTD
jgi:hypothetical protein